MTALLSTQVRRLDRAERRWLHDARDRLRRTDDARTPVAVPGRAAPRGATGLAECIEVAEAAGDAEGAR